MWVAVAVGASTALGVYSSTSAAKAQNAAATRAEQNAQQRYNIENSQTVSMMEEQQNIATEKMTEVSLDFMKQLGTFEAASAETLTGGNVRQRQKFDLLAKEGKVKGQVAKEINTNIINLAQGMLTSKIDTQAMIAEAAASRQNVALAGVSGAIDGFSSGVGLASSGIKFKSMLG